MDNLDPNAVTPAPTDPNAAPPVDPNAAAPVDPNVAAPVDPKAPITPTWPSDWRGLVSTDPKEAARLQRFSDVPSLYKSFRELETKMSSGKFKPDLPADATPEQLTEYRKAIGIPEKPEGYFEKLPDGMVIGDEDKAALGMFAEALHEENATPQVFNKVMETAFKLIELNQHEAVAAALETKQQARQTLYEKWGPADYKINTNAISNVLAGMPQSLRARFEGAQLADGSLMFNDVEAMEWWAQHAREMNPALGVMPAGTGDVVGGIEKELADNRNMMRTPSQWFAKENDARRARHTQLLETLESYKKRA